MATSNEGEHGQVAQDCRLGRAARKRAKQKEQRTKRAERNATYRQVRRAGTPDEEELFEDQSTKKPSVAAHEKESQAKRQKCNEALAGSALGAEAESAGWESPVDEWGDNDELEQDAWHAEGDTWDGTWRAAGGASWGDSGAGWFGDAKQKVRDEMARVKELTQSMAAFTQKKQLAEAVAIFDQVSAEGLRPSKHTHAALVNAYVCSGEMDQALRALQGMQQAGCPPNVVVYTSILK
eukprot:gene28370-35157_t